VLRALASIIINWNLPVIKNIQLGVVAAPEAKL